MPSLDKNLPSPPADLDQRVWDIDASDDNHVKPGMRLGFRPRPRSGSPGVWQLVELDGSGAPRPDGAITDSELTVTSGPFLSGTVDYRGHSGSTELLVMFYALLLPRTGSGADRIHRLIARSGHGLADDASRVLNHNGTWHGSGGGD